MRFSLATAVLLVAAGAAQADPGFESHEVRVRIDAAAHRIDGVDRAVVRRDGGGTLTFRLRDGFEVTSVRIDEAEATFTRGDASPAGAEWRIGVPAGVGARCLATIGWTGTLTPATADGPPASSEAGPDGVLLAAADAWFPSGAPARVAIDADAGDGWIAVAGPGSPAAGGAGADAPARVTAGRTPWIAATAVSGAWLAAGRWTFRERTADGVKCAVYLAGTPADADAALGRIVRAVADTRAHAPAARIPQLDVFVCPGPPRALSPAAVVVPAETLAAPPSGAAAGTAAAPPRSELRREIALAWFGGGGPDSPADALASLLALDADSAPLSPADAARRRRALAIAAAASDVAGRRSRAVLFLHDLRRNVGATAFRAGVTLGAGSPGAGWDVWRSRFETAAGRALGDEFTQGLARKGLPSLEFGPTRVRTESGRILISGVVRQRLAPGETPWRIAVPLVVEHLEGRDETILDLAAAECGFSIPSASMPIRIHLDPDNHMLRSVVPEEDQPGTPSRLCRLLLPDLRAATSPERISALVAKLAAGRAGAAGPAGDAAVRRIVADELRMAGVEPEEQPVVFRVKDTDPAAPVLTGADGVPVAGVVPLVASPETPAEGLRIVGAVGDDDEDVAGRALVVDIAGGTADPMPLLRQAASLAVARRAAAIFVRRPETAGPGVAALWEFPSGAAPGERDAALRRASAVSVSAGTDAELPLPVVAVPASFRPAKDAFWRLDVRFGQTEVRTANVAGRIAGRGRTGTGPVVLAASLDGGAASDAGVASVVEAVQVLAARPDVLARDVTIVFTSADAWGERGLRSWVRDLRPAAVPLAVVFVDAVHGPGRLAVRGCAADSRLGRTVAAAAAYSAVDLDSAPPAVGPRGAALPRSCASATVSLGDPDAPFDPVPAARLARAVALTALAVSGGW